VNRSKGRLPVPIVRTLIALISVGMLVSAESPLDIRSAISHGRKFKSRSRYIEKGMKTSRVFITELDGVAKMITFFDDYDIVAAAAAEATQKMLPFTVTDTQDLPLRGLVYARVSLIGTYWAAYKVEARYVQHPAHLVLQFGNTVIQPVSKETTKDQSDSVELPVSVFAFWNTKHVSVLAQSPLAMVVRQAELEFVFQLSEVQKKATANVILIDGDGNHHQKRADLSVLLHH
jgi:hypothetical protein